MNIITYTEFNGEYEQAQSSEREMSYQTSARNYAKESGNHVQPAENACCRSISCSKTCGTGESSYSHYTSILNFASIEFSMTLSQIRKFETLNISINVYINEKGFVPILLADRKKSKHVNLFGG